MPCHGMPTSPRPAWQSTAGFGDAQTPSLGLQCQPPLPSPPLARSFPHRKKLLAAATVMGGSLAAAARYLLGSWLPRLTDLPRSPLFLAYLGLSALVGLTVTYWFNDASSVKACPLGMGRGPPPRCRGALLAGGALRCACGRCTATSAGGGDALAGLF